MKLSNIYDEKCQFGYIYDEKCQCCYMHIHDEKCQFSYIHDKKFQFSYTHDAHSTSSAIISFWMCILDIPYLSFVYIIFAWWRGDNLQKKPLKLLQWYMPEKLVTQYASDTLQFCKLLIHLQDVSWHAHQIMQVARDLPPSLFLSSSLVTPGQ